MASKTIYLDEIALRRAEEMAEEEGRSFSNLVAYLISQEWYRRQRAAEMAGPSPDLKIQLGPYEAEIR